MNAVSRLSIQALHPHVGARVEGVDLREPLDDAAFARIRDALHEHSVLVFHDQRISDEQQVAFGRRFGELERTTFAVASDNPWIYRLSNVDASGKVLAPDAEKRHFLAVNARWHTDSSFRPTPAMASMLSAREIPSAESGDTEFASMCVGYDALAEDRKRLIGDMVAVHSYAYSLSLFPEAGVTREELNSLPPVQHPLVSKHPATGRKCLFVSGHIERIVGLPQAEGRTLVDELIDWCTRPQYVYRHRWRQHDLVIWDNRCTLHRVTSIPANEARMMHRVTIAGDAPPLWSMGEPAR